MNVQLSHSQVFWLLPLLLAVLILFRLYRGRRREILAGSFLLWRRLAQQQPRNPPRRFIVDLSLLLQCAAVAAFVAALAGPALAFGKQAGQLILLVLDNGPLARERDGNGIPLLHQVAEQARTAIAQLKPEDRVAIITTSPSPRLITDAPLSPAEAASRLPESAALSTRPRDAVMLFAHDMARNLGQKVRVRSFSPHPSVKLRNVGIAGFGSVPLGDGFQILVRLRNFSDHGVEGTLSTRTQTQSCTLEAGGERAFAFNLPADAPEKLIVAWKTKDGQPDALPEDDTLVAVREKNSSDKPLRVRFEQPAPAVERLFRTALKAVIVPNNDSAPVDLDVSVNAVPPAYPPNAGAILLLAPESGFLNVFDVGPALLADVQVRRQDDDPLTRGVADRPEGIFSIARAREVRRTGDFKTILQDARSQRPLAGRFVAAGNHTGYFLAFIPGENSSEKLLPPELAALLIRMVLESAHAGEPYQAESAAELEARTGAPLPMELKPESYAGGFGVLDEKVSNLTSQDSAPLDFSDEGSREPEPQRNSVDLSPWLILLGLGLAAFELSRECRRVARP